MTVPAQFDALLKDGFGVFENAVPTSTVQRLIHLLDSLPGSRGSRRRGLGAPYAIRNLLSLVRQVDGLPESPELLTLVHPILGENARPVRGILFDKTPQANWAVSWHQDCSIAVVERSDLPGFGPWSVKAGIHHVRPPIAILERMLTLRLHLDDCPTDNGPLRVVPGSHRMGIIGLDQIHAAHSAGSVRELPVGAGGVVAMRPLLLHSSRPCHNAAHRRVIHIEYAGVDLPQGLSWLEHGA